MSVYEHASFTDFVRLFLAITLAAPALAFLAAVHLNFVLGFALGMAGAVAWMAGIQVGLYRYGRKFGWFLLTAPAGLFVPLFILRWIYGASHGDPRWMAP